MLTMNLTLITQSYLFIAAATVFFFDYFLTLDEEVRLVWSIPRWSCLRLFFFMNRYLPIFNIVACMQANFRSNTLKQCEIDLWFILWLTSFGIMFAELILTLRTIAIWKNRKVSIALFVLFFCGKCFPAIFITYYQGHSFQFINKPRGCQLATAGRHITSALAMIAIWETLIIVLTVTKASDHLRHTSSGWVRKIYQDGIIYYFAILIMTVINLSLFAISTEPHYQFPMSLVQHIGHSVCCNHVILSILSNHDDLSDPMGRISRRALASVIVTQDIDFPSTGVGRSQNLSAFN